MSIKKVEIPNEIYSKLMELQQDGEDLSSILERLSSSRSSNSTNKLTKEKKLDYKDNDYKDNEESRLEDQLLDDDRRARRTWKI